MKKVFLDTNILIDLIADRKPFSKYAMAIFTAAENKKLKLFTSSHSIATTYYLLKKYHDDKTLRQIVLGLFDYITVLSVDASILTQGLRSKHKDFEDAIQIHCAMSVDNITCIVTRNIKDFKGSEVAVFAPEEFCATM